MASILAFSEGLRKGEEYEQKSTLANLAIAQGTAQLKTAEAAAAVQEKTLAHLSQLSENLHTKESPDGIATPGSDAIAESMDLAGLAFMEMGQVEKAKEFFTAGGTVRTNAANVADKQTELEIQRANTAASIFASVTDQKTWEQANNVFELQMGIPSKYKKLPYDPALVTQLQQGIQTVKDRALTDAARARQKASESEVKDDAQKTQLLKAQIENTKARTEALKKNGAAATVEPKAEDLRVITDLMMSEFGASLIPEESRVRARPIAERMVQIMKEQSVSRNQAGKIAYQEAKSAGELGGLRKRSARQGAEDNPIELPRLKSGEVDRSKMIDNRWYTVNGEPMLLMGSKLYSKDMLSSDMDDEEEEEE